MYRKLAALLGLTLAVGACADDPLGLTPGGPDRDINVSTGTLAVDLRFDGVPLADHNVGNACEAQVRLGGQFLSTWRACSGSTLHFEVPAGEQEVEVHFPIAMRTSTGISWYSEPVGPAQKVTVLAGQTTVHVVETSANYGLATGKLTVGGEVPVSGQFGVCAFGWNNDQCAAVAADGSFGTLGRNVDWATVVAQVLERTHNTVAAELTPTFTVGQKVELGTVNVNPGALRVRPVFNGTPLADLGLAEQALCTPLIIDGRWVGGPCSIDRTLPAVMAGPRMLRMESSYDAGGGTWKTDTLAAAEVTLAGGQTTLWAPDLGAKLGLVQAKILVDGQVPTQRYFLCTPNGPCSQTDAEGMGRVLVRPGPGEIIVRSPTWAILTELPFTATAGEVTDLGTVSADVGNLRIELLFGGAALPAGIANLCNFTLLLNENHVGAWLCNPANPGVAEVTGLGVGTHNLQVRYPWLWTVGETTFTLAAGESKTVQIELGTSLGLVSATVKVNEQAPAANSYILGRFSEWDPATNRPKDPDLWVPVPEGGVMLFFDHPGARLTQVRSQTSNTVLSEFGYSVVAGQTTVVGTTEGGAAGKTETGEDITVKPVDSSTGETFVELTFGEVLEAGQTTVSSSSTPPPSNPLPDTVSAGSNPIYYNIDTSATFEGTVKLCFNYPDDHGFTTESAIRLYHGMPDGTWEDITTAGYPDTENNIICGDVSSFSPFVLVQGKATSPEQKIQALVASVGETGLAEDQGQALKAKLDAALKSLQRGNRGAAINQLGAFRNQVEALVRSGRLAAASGDHLKAQVDAVIAQIRST